MSGCRLFVAWGVGLAMSALTSTGAEYWVSPQGNDEADGSEQHPWQSIAKVNAAVSAGDTVHFLAGSYGGCIAPENSGEPGKPITLRSAVRHAAVLTGEGPNVAVNLVERAHIVLEDFAFDMGGRGCWLRANGSDHITIRGCLMRRARAALDMFRCEHIRLLDNVLSMDLVGGNMVQMRECSFILIEGNSFTRVGHSPLQLTVCRNVCVRANCFRNNWGRNYEFWSTGRLLVEDNIVTQARDSGYSADSRAKNLYIDSIYRFNRVFENMHTPLNSGSYMPMGAKPTATFREPFKLVDSRIYHNTITGNLGHGWEFGGLNISGNAVYNNIFYGNDRTAAGVQLVINDRISQDNRFHHNLIAGNEPGGPTVQWGGEHWSTEELNQKTRVMQFWSAGIGNLDAVPEFADVLNRDYRLRDASPGIDAGMPLTLAIGAGSGRRLPVADGRVFYDGFGIEGERGDWICVGNATQRARIEQVELRYAQAAILSLDRDVEWEDGDPVSLPWSGSAPDVGAYETGLAHPTRVLALAEPASPAPGQAVRFRIDPLGKEVRSVLWNFADGSQSHDLEPVHTYAEPGQHGVTVRVECADGERCIAVTFVDVSVPRPADAPLVWADFEDATRDKDWGYLFKFYRQRLTGYSHEARQIGDGKCMRLFRADGKANSVAGCLAPGAWFIDAYPTVRFAYRIPPGTPVGICVEPFVGPGLPRRILLGGTDSRHGRSEDGSVAADTGDYRLIDDDAWHEITVDMRRVRQVVPELQYLRVFQFHCYWKADAEHEFRFDDFAILPAGQP